MKQHGKEYKGSNLTVLLFIFALLIFAPGAANAQESSGQFGGGSVKIGYDNRTCDPSLEGAIRYYSGGGGANAPSSGLVGYWPLDEITYTSAADGSGNARDGSMQGGLDPSSDSVTGQVNGALHLDDVDDYIDLGTGCMISGDTWTVGLWVNPDVGVDDWDRIFEQGKDACSSRQFVLLWYGGKVQVHQDTGSHSNPLEAASGAVNTGEWTHIIWTYDNGTNTIYQGGSDSTTSPYTGQGVGVQGNIAIGQRTGFSNYYGGAIDEVYVYDRVLNSTEIQQLYQASGGSAPAIQFCDGSDWVTLPGP